MRADDTPDEYPDVDEQLLADYPALAPLFEEAKRKGRSTACDPPELAELIGAKQLQEDEDR